MAKRVCAVMVWAMLASLAACTGTKGDTGAQGPQGEPGAQGPVGPKGDKGDPGPFASPNGCADGTVEQTWNAAMVGCNNASYSDGGTVWLPIRNAGTVCSAGWHVCELGEWNTNRATTLSQVNRWIRAKISCNACPGDLVVSSATADLCEYNPTGCNSSYAFFVGPVQQDAFCGPTWPAGLNNGNLGRSVASSGGTGPDPQLASAHCLTASGGPTTTSGGTSPVVGTMCCR